MRNVALAAAIWAFSASMVFASAADDMGFPDEKLPRLGDVKSSYLRNERVCWGEDYSHCVSYNKNANGTYKVRGWEGMTYFQPCTATNKLEGWVSGKICNSLCDVDHGPRCGVYTERDDWSFEGNRCGYRLAIVQCYQTPKTP